MLILFGGGDGGGIYIGADGKIHRIPPWNPDVMKELKAANAVLSAAEGLHDKAVAKELHGLGERLTAGTIPQLVKSAGQVGASAELVAFVDGDDGFYCGSTGKHPGHFPVPHGPPTLSQEAGAFGIGSGR